MSISRYNILSGLIIVIIIFFSACNEDRVHSDIIYEGENYIVTADSIVDGGIIFRPPFSSFDFTHEIENKTVLLDSFPHFHSSAGVIDAIYENGMKELMLSDITDSLFMYDLDYSPLGPDIISWMSMAIISPDKTMDLLRKQAENQFLGNWPLFNSRIAWITAAWDVYCITGSQEWLNEAYRISSEMLLKEIEVSYDKRMKLIKGGLKLIDIDSRIKLYPRWVSAKDIFSSLSLINNLFFLNGVDLVRKMAHELNIEFNVEIPSRDKMNHIINRAYWIPEKNYYSEYLYAEPFYLQSYFADNVASAIAVILDVATPGMANLIIEKSPKLDDGMPAIFPRPLGMRLPGNDHSWPLTNAIWGVAAAKNENMDALSAALAAVAKSSILNDGQDEYGAAMVILVLRAIAGIEMSLDGMTLNPSVPEFFNDTIFIKNLKYRQAVLDISIIGTGSEIESFRIDDDICSNNIVPHDLTPGKHVIAIKMRNYKSQNGGVSSSQPVWAPPVPEIEWASLEKGEIVDFSKSNNYELYINGILDSELNTQEFTLPLDSVFNEICVVPVSATGWKGYSSAPHFVYPKGVLTTIQAEEIVKPGTKLIKDRRLSQRIVHSDSKINPIIEFTINEDCATGAFITVCYSNGNGNEFNGSMAALRKLIVNGESAGTLFMPAHGSGWWLSTHQSNMISCKLQKGENRIAIVVDENLQADIPVLIDYMRIIRFPLDKLSKW